MRLDRYRTFKNKRRRRGSYGRQTLAADLEPGLVLVRDRPRDRRAQAGEQSAVAAGKCETSGETRNAYCFYIYNLI